MVTLMPQSEPLAVRERALYMHVYIMEYIRQLVMIDIDKLQPGYPGD